MRAKTIIRRLVVSSGVVAVALLVGRMARVGAYTTEGHVWGVSQVPYYVNPSNMYGLAANDVIHDFQQAASAWSTQANISVQLVYAGTTTSTNLALDNRNNVFMRNDSNGSYAGATYWWYDVTGHLVDADIVLYEAPYSWYANNTGCTGSGQYVQDVATHEFGHVLGLWHSDVPTATMYPIDGYCDLDWESLDPDDISGIQSLYPSSKTSTTSPPTAPTQLVALTDSAVPSSAIDLSWVDLATNASGYRVERSVDGVNFAAVAQLGASAIAYVDSGLTAGTTYYYRISAYNNSGSSGYSNIASGQTQASASALSPSPPSAPYSPSPADGATSVSTNATLGWSDSGAQSYDVYVNGTIYASDIAATSVALSGLSNSTGYTWMVVAKNAAGTTAGPTWSFTTRNARGRKK